MKLQVYVEPKSLNWIVSVVTRAFSESNCEVPKISQIFENDGKLISLKLDTPYRVPGSIIATLKKLFGDEGWKNGAVVKEDNGVYSFLKRPPHLKIYGSESEMQQLCHIVDDAYLKHNMEQPEIELIQRSDGKHYLDVKTKRIPNEVFSTIWEMIKQNR